jgi:hypothetical protein
MRTLLFPAVFSFTCLAALAADQAPATFTNPAEAGPDFAIQGEYAGEGCGAQVIALGGGKFRILGYVPGLPGAAPDVEKKAEVNASREGARVVFDDAGWKGHIENGVLIGVNEEGATWKLSKTERRSPTLGMAPPEGAVVLFDGTNVEQWKGGKLLPDGTLAMGTKSAAEFGSATLHIEFRTPFMPEARGQARGNSGVYLQDRYEVQVLDSFGLSGENNECGGIYGIAKPAANLCFPPLSWQTFDIEFEAAEFDEAGKKTRNARMTVRHNGVLIHDAVEVPKATAAAGRPEGREPGPIQLQNHGNPVAYRNIWVLPKR